MVEIINKIEKSFEVIENIKNLVSQDFFGQKKVVEQVLCCIFCSGSPLLVGVPGLGKTMLFQLIANCLNLQSSRIQCTPDLMPSDILGVEVLSKNKQNEFTFLKGPIFTQLLMIDEINRASPRTQSALLQAMEEKIITVSGKNYSLPNPFIVLATQNPIEQEGTFSLPEAQLDRFLMQINIDYPNRETEEKILINDIRTSRKKIKNIETQQLSNICDIVNKLPVGKSVVDFTLKLVRNLRPISSDHKYVKKYIQWGPGPRGGLALLNAAKAKALIMKKKSPSVADIVSLAQPALRHRMSLNFEARTEKLDIDQIIAKVCQDTS